MLITEKFIKVKINNSIWSLTLHRIIINVTKRNLVYKIRLINFLTILFEYYVIPILFLNIFQYINNNFVYDSTRNDPSNDCSPGEEDIFQGIRFIRCSIGHHSIPFTVSSNRIYIRIASLSPGLVLPSSFHFLPVPIAFFHSGVGDNPTKRG